MRESNECLSRIIRICTGTQADLCEVKATEMLYLSSGT